MGIDKWVDPSASGTAAAHYAAVVRGVVGTSPDLVQNASAAAAVTAALTPTFTPIRPVGSSFVVSQLALRVGTGVAASTGGLSIYEVVWSSAGVFTMTLKCQLNAAVATTSSGVKAGDITIGAAGSGAGTLNLDFANKDYMIGSMVSTITTLTVNGAGAAPGGVGALKLTSAARSTTDDWPATITDATGATAAAANGSRINWTAMIDATGKFWL